MDEREIIHHKNEIRDGIQKQFMAKLVKSPEFPYLQSMGVDHLFQAFEAEDEHEIGFIGILHIWYHDKVWETEWIDKAEDGMALVQFLQKVKPYDEMKLMGVAMERIYKYAKKERMRAMRGQIDRYDEEQSKDDDEDEDITLN